MFRRVKMGCSGTEQERVVPSKESASDRSNLASARLRGMSTGIRDSQERSGLGGYATE